MSVIDSSSQMPHRSTTTPVAPSAESSVVFPDRRSTEMGSAPPVIERRQFGNTHSDLSPEARELGQTIDQYKLVHRRRFITYEEMLSIIRSLGYRK